MIFEKPGPAREWTRTEREVLVDFIFESYPETYQRYIWNEITEEICRSEHRFHRVEVNREGVQVSDRCENCGNKLRWCSDPVAVHWALASGSTCRVGSVFCSRCGHSATPGRDECAECGSSQSKEAYV